MIIFYNRQYVIYGIFWSLSWDYWTSSYKICIFFLSTQIYMIGI